MSTRPRTDSDALSTSALELHASSGHEERRRGGGHHVGLSPGLKPNLLVLTVAERQRERHAERDEGQQQDVRQRQHQAAAKAYGPISSGALNRKPTPRTVWR